MKKAKTLHRGKNILLLTSILSFKGIGSVSEIRNLYNIKPFSIQTSLMDNIESIDKVFSKVTYGKKMMEDLEGSVLLSNIKHLNFTGKIICENFARQIACQQAEKLLEYTREKVEIVRNAEAELSKKCAEVGAKCYEKLCEKKDLRSDRESSAAVKIAAIIFGTGASIASGGLGAFFFGGGALLAGKGIEKIGK